MIRTCHLLPLTLLIVVGFALLAEAHTQVEVSRRPTLGLELTRSMGEVRVASVAQASAAEDLGLLPDDRIVSINDQSVATYHDVMRCVAGCPLGECLHLIVERAGHRSTLTARLE